MLPKLAEQLLALRRQRDEFSDQVEALVEAHPLHEVLTSVPGIGVRTCARILTEVTGKHFASAAHRASHAGLAPVTRRSGTSIRGEHPNRRGNKKLIENHRGTPAITGRRARDETGWPKQPRATD